MQQSKDTAGYYENILAGNETETIKQAWVDVESALQEMKTITQRQNIEFMVVILPRRDQVNGANHGKAYNLKLSRILDRNNINKIEMLEVLKTAYKIYGKDMFIPWDGHNSKITNKLIANEIKKRIEP